MDREKGEGAEKRISSEQQDVQFKLAVLGEENFTQETEGSSKRVALIILTGCVKMKEGEGRETEVHQNIREDLKLMEFAAPLRCKEGTMCQDQSRASK